MLEMKKQNLDITDLVYKISVSAIAIDFGLKIFAVIGIADDGRLSYENGIAGALSGFRGAQSTIDPQPIILVKYTFGYQVLQFWGGDTGSHSGITQAIQSFSNAFPALKAVEDSALYQGTELTHPKHKVPHKRLF